jgi:hypothetical protein
MCVIRKSFGANLAKFVSLGGRSHDQTIKFERAGVVVTIKSSPMSISRMSRAGDRRRSLWGLSRRARAIDHLLYESNGGLWRWVTGGRGNVLSIGVVVIASTRPPPNRLLGLGQP